MINDEDGVRMQARIVVDKRADLSEESDHSRAIMSSFELLAHGTAHLNRNRKEEEPFPFWRRRKHHRRPGPGACRAWAWLAASQSLEGG